MYDSSNSENLESSNLSESYYHLLELSSDLRQLFENRIYYDFVLYVGKKAIPCHKAILCARSKWLSSRIDDVVSDQSNSLTLEEDESLVKALLEYIYTGNMNSIESLKIPLLDLVHNVSKYGIRKLNKLLFSLIKSSSIYNNKQTHDFVWKVNVEDCKLHQVNCPSVEKFNLNGTDEWHLYMRPYCLSDGRYYFRIFLVRETKTCDSDSIKVMNLEISIMDIHGAIQRTFYHNYVFKNDFQCKMPDYFAISLNKLLERSDLLYPDGTFKLLGNITVCSEDLNSENRVIFELPDYHQKVKMNELHALSRDMYEMMKAARFCDTSILFKNLPLIRMHSCILHCRSRIPYKEILKNLELFDGFGSIAWRSFVNFLYSGQARFLEDHMRLVYSFVSELRLDEAREKYSRILGNSLTVSNVYGVFSNALKYNDEYLMTMAKKFMICHSREIVEDSSWHNLTCEYPKLSREIMRCTRYKRLPHQEKKSKCKSLTNK